MSAYRRTFSREDPRLNRQPSNMSPKGSEHSNNESANNGQTAPDNWNAQAVTYNHTQALQNAYQSLPFHNTGGHQYPTQTYYTGYHNYSYNPYENYQASQQQATTYVHQAGEPRPPGEEYPHGSWMASNSYPATTNQAQPTPEMKENANACPTLDKKKTDAVAEEKIKQLAGLIKERDTYEDRVSSLKKKLRLLISQKEDLSAKRSPDNENLRIIKENTKLQVEIQSKIKDATNVIEILSNLIGDKKKTSKASVETTTSRNDVPAISGSDKINYKHFDPEIHWCRLCDVFPQSAKELLLHLHSKEHQTSAAAQEEIPWHKLPPEPKFPTYEGAPVKRVPIKGLQFFVASTAWYCRLCDVWIGDLHCASQHLMSVSHSQNYSNFVEQNAHWETEWMKDREKALERLKRSKGDRSAEDASKRRDKYSPTAIPDAKKKKRSKRRKKKHSSDESSSSSSSSSSSEDEEEDKSKSIRVAMRKKILDGDGKLDILEKIVRQGKMDDGPEDKLLSQWMNTTEPAGKDKQLLDNLKEKLKQKQDAEKAKLALEAEIAKRQKERDEMERKERELQQQQAQVKEEEKKHREKMSLKLKQQPSIRDAHRRRSKSRTPERYRRRSISPTAPPRRSYRNGRDGRDHDERSPRFERSRKSRSRSYERSRDRRRSRSRSRDSRRDRDDDDRSNKLKDRKLPFIGRMPLFKNNKPKPKDDEHTREIQKEDYEPPRKTRFQPGNLARAFIPQPEVVCFPQLSSLPPIPPPPPPITPVVVPEPPKISAPKPPPPPKLHERADPPKLEAKAEKALMEAAREEAEAEPEVEEETQEDTHMIADQAVVDAAVSEDYMLYEDASNTLFQYGNVNYNMMYPSAYNYIPGHDATINAEITSEIQAEANLPKSHTLPLEPPPLPPDDPEEDLAMLGLSSDDMAVQQMY